MTAIQQLPRDCDLAQLGLRPERVTKVELLHQRRINWIYRIWCGKQSWILKWVAWPQKSRDLFAYQLLMDCGVPVLPHRRAKGALLLEDLERSQHWRLALEADASSEETGCAVAAWYQQLHAAGRRLFERNDPRLRELQWEFATLSADAMRATAQRLALAGQAGWELAEAHLQDLVAAARRLPMTFNYNDFHWSNLALPREGSGASPVLFDYHLAGVGLAYSDCRNVLSCLQGAAAEAFRETYGPFNEAERVLDRPLALVHGLLMAAQSPVRPTWANDLIGQVRGGLLEHWVREGRAAPSPSVAAPRFTPDARVRALGTADAAALHELARLEVVAWDEPPRAQHIAARWERLKKELEELNSTRKGMLVAVYSGKLVGICRVRPTADDPECWLLYGVAVHPDHRRRGVGRALVQAGADFVREHGGRVLRSQSHVDNPLSQRFHTGVGFEETYRFVSPTDGDHLIAYQMFLPQGL